MYSDIDKTMKQMMLDYLEIAHPISRVKHLHKFRRAIVLDTGIYVLADELKHNQLRNDLANELRLIFDCDDAIVFAILDNFLNLKKQASRPLR